MRFIAIIEDPGRVTTTYAVVDTTRGVRLCSCSDIHNAEMIADCLNTQQREKFSKFMFSKLTGKTPERHAVPEAGAP